MGASRPRVIVGLSGGVDSSVAAMLLGEQGYEVHALHMTNWDDDEGYCTAAEDLQDARRVCDRLGIPLHHVNFAAEYRERVFAGFLEDYRAGYTPNPDVLCNREIKFGVFREYASRLGGDLIATGHYARVRRGRGTARLLRGVDVAKDQSYFLHAVAADALGDTLFPLGELEKGEVRRLARDHGLPTHDKRDSTGICFIGERPFREFLSRFVAARPGPIVDENGREVGRHHGLPHYTIGQRQGLGIGGRRDGAEAPWYVAARDFARNTLVAVQGSDHALLYTDRLLAVDAHWIGGPPSALRAGRPARLTAKIRYRQRDQYCDVRAGDDGTLEVRFDQPQRAVAPGQFVVFYDGEVCLGGARISAAGDARRPVPITMAAGREAG